MRRIHRSVARMLGGGVGVLSVSALALAPAQGASVSEGTYDYSSNFADVHNPVSGIASFDGTNLTTPGPTDEFELTLNDGSSSTPHSYSDVTFSLTTAPAAQGTIVQDGDSNGVDDGDALMTTFGNGAFQFTDDNNANKVIVEGSFTDGSFTGSIGENSGTFSADGLDLTAGNGFVFDNGTFVDQISDPEGLTIALASIPNPGLSVSNTSNLVSNVYSGDLDSFGTSNGSINTSGTIDVVPEPASAALFATGFGLILVGQRKRRRKS